MAVRITFPDGSVTLFTYATTAVWKGRLLGVYRWNQEQNGVEEITTLPPDRFARVEVLHGNAVTSMIPGEAASSSA